MQHLIKKTFDNSIDVYSMADKYYSVRTPFTGLQSPLITNESWQYSINHLPVSVFLTNKKQINYVLHLPGDHYYMPPNSKQNVTFSGWKVYEGEIHKCTCILDNSGSSDKCCVIHINLRDIYTDALEFLSNLILHIKYMQLHNTDSVVFCKLNEGFQNRRKLYHANLKSIANTCSNDTIISYMDLNNAPKYSVKFNSMDIARAETFIAIKFDTIFAEILSRIVALCENHQNIKIHVIQGACTQFTLMTTQHPGNQDISNVPLSNQYGGAYQEYDEYLARLLKRQGGSLWNVLNTLNDGWYQYAVTNGVAYGMLNLNKIKISSSMDPIFIELVGSIPADETHVILNINYSFGSESQFIAQSMQKCFAEKLSSFQVVGKAGGIGDKVKLNDYVICNHLSIAYANNFNIPKNKSTIKIPSAKKIDKSLHSGNVAVFESGVKIMPCVLFEAKEYLESIRSNYFAVEMEGFWFQNAFKPSLPTAYLYYISDLPLETSLAHENYPEDEGQMLFNGLLRMGFRWIKSIVEKRATSFSRRSPQSPISPGIADMTLSRSGNSQIQSTRRAQNRSIIT